MKLDRCTVAAVLMTRNGVNFVAASSPINITLYEPVCPFDYVHLRTYNGGALIDNIKGVRFRKNNTDNRVIISRREPTAETQTLPIKIVRQGNSTVDFVVQNSAWFAFEAASSSFFDVGNNSTMHAFIKLPTDIFGSEHCYASEGFSSARRKVLKAHCSAGGSSTVVRVYARFDNADNKEPSALKIPMCCRNQYDSDASFSKVVEYTFQLNCLPMCENPIKYIDDETDESMAASTLFEHSNMSSATHISKSTTSVASTANVSEPLEKQNRVRGAGAKANAKAKAWALARAGANTKHASWDEMYQRLVEYKSITGNANVPRNFDQDPKLGTWVHTQRKVYNRNKMSVERADLLNSIGFEWGARSSTWNDMYLRLVAYQKVHNGDANVPRNYDQDAQLGNWVHNQRKAYKNSKMPREHETLLNSIGFNWNSHSSSWNEMYQRLIAYKQGHNGDTDVPQRYDQDPQLGEWVNNQRRHFKNKKISIERVSQLNFIGFDWGTPQIDRWNEMYLRLVAYQTVHSNAKVSNKYDQDTQLGAWIRSQRTAYKNGMLSSEHVELLNAIGFTWDARPNTWGVMYQRLVAYKNKHNGDTKVPIKYKQDPQLGMWVSNQRRHYKKKNMSDERASLLNSIEFDWGATKQETWNEMYQRLIVYKNEHNGDTKVPRQYNQDPQLGEWVSTQRKTHKSKRMPKKRAIMLKSAGFDWDIETRLKTKPDVGIAVSAEGTQATILHNTAIDSGSGAVGSTSAADATADGSVADTPFRAATEHLQGAARSAHSDVATTFTQGSKITKDLVAHGTERPCNTIRRTSQLSRILCAYTNNGSNINFNILKSKFPQTYSKSVTILGSLERPSINIFKKLFQKKHSQNQ